MANSSCLVFKLNLLVIFNLLLTPISFIQAQVLFIFGDSLYDAGNKQHLTPSNVPASHFPYGMSIGKATGRWSDGRIVPDFLSERLSIPLIPPVLDEKADLSHGASFATADATVLGAHLETMSLTNQIQKFSEKKNEWNNDQIGAGVYLFYIGSEDYLNFAKTHPDPTQEEQKNFINQVIKNIEKALVDLHGFGGGKFAFQNLAALGCLPIVKQEYKSGDQCVELLSHMAEQHNMKLLETLEKLSDDLDGFKYIIFDYFNSTTRRVDRPETYSYSTADLACCGSGSHDAYGCGFEKGSTICRDPSAYLFFDGKHNTEKANEQMAQLMFSSDPVVVWPNNLRELYVFPVNSGDIGTTSRNHGAYQV